MPTIFKKKAPETKKLLSTKRETKVDLKLKRKFVPAQMQLALQRLHMFYGTDDKLGFIIKLLEKGISQPQYHQAIITELENLKGDLKIFLKEPDTNKPLIEKSLELISKLMSSKHPQYYRELIEALKELRISLFKIEDTQMNILNEQLKLLLNEFPELFPDVPIEYDHRDEEQAMSFSLEDFSQLFDISYQMLIALEAGDASKVKSLLKALNKFISAKPSEDEKNILGYAKYIILLFMDSAGRDVIKAKEIIKISVIFQLIIRYFIIRLKIDYPGDMERVKARLTYHNSK